MYQISTIDNPQNMDLTDYITDMMDIPDTPDISDTPELNPLNSIELFILAIKEINKQTAIHDLPMFMEDASRNPNIHWKFIQNNMDLPW